MNIFPIIYSDKTDDNNLNTLKVQQLHSSLKSRSCPLGSKSETFSMTIKEIRKVQICNKLLVFNYVKN